MLLVIVCIYVPFPSSKQSSRKGYVPQAKLSTDALNGALRKPSKHACRLTLWPDS